MYTALILLSYPSVLLSVFLLLAIDIDTAILTSLVFTLKEMSLQRLTRERNQHIEATRTGGPTGVAGGSYSLAASGNESSNTPSTTATAAIHLSPAQARIRSDLAAVKAVKSTITIDGVDPYLIHVVHRPTSGIWCGGVFSFSIHLSEDYPYQGPKVRYVGPHRIFHPNIEGDESMQDWGVCLGLQTQWVPTYTIKDIITLIELLFRIPNADDSLSGVSKMAADVYKSNQSQFETIARRWMTGNYSM